MSHAAVDKMDDSRHVALSTFYPLLTTHASHQRHWTWTSIISLNSDKCFPIFCEWLIRFRQNKTNWLIRFKI